MYTTDTRDHLTARQRRTLDRFMKDETGKPTMNFTKSNGAQPELQTPNRVHLHLYNDDSTVGATTLYGLRKEASGYQIDDDDPAAGSLATSTTSGREPALAGEDIEDRLENLERAVVVLAQGGDLDDGGDDDDQNSFTTGSSGNTPDPDSQMASAHVRQQQANDELPSAASINEKNKVFWSNTSSQSVSAMGSPSATPPNSREGQPGRTDSGIDVNRRLSTGSQRLNAGRTSQSSVKSFNTTNDAAPWHHNVGDDRRAIARINARNVAQRMGVQSYFAGTPTPEPRTGRPTTDTWDAFRASAQLTTKAIAAVQARNAAARASNIWGPAFDGKAK
jgi:hypothetical protein